MILLWFTRQDAEVLAKCCIEPNLRATIEKALHADLIPCDEAPRTILLEDHGNGLQMSAVAFFTQAAADRAAAQWWKQVVGDEEGEPGHMKQMPKQRPGTSKQDYQTPSDFLAAVKSRLRIRVFDIDLAADATNTAAKRFYSKAENALVQPWKVGNGWNWLNPEFGDIAPWVERAWQQASLGAQTAVLVPAGVGSNWWRDFVHGKAQALLLNGRLTFVGHPTCYPKDCCLLLYGPHVPAQYSVWTWPLQIKKAAA